jgi:ATP-dependent helicase HrpB
MPDARRIKPPGCILAFVNPPALPVEPVLPALSEALERSGSAVLQAPPGAGKTTLVPLALRDAPWLKGRKILLLEPRRIAARAAARRMASLLGEAPGQTVGYRIRRDTVVGPGTRIEVLTEGILTRMVQHDPELSGVGLVIFDEFHERSLHADLGLALVLESRAVVRPDLRLLVMSATLDGAAVAALLGGAPVISSEGRAFPVVTRYLPRRPEQRVEAAVAGAVRQALAESDGDILAFLPGSGEITRAADLLAGDPAALRGATIFPLHGMLAGEGQDAAIAPSPAGRRKVVLATSIAETSITIEGVRVVVDGGLARVPRFSPGSGMTRLVTVRVSRASADQRRGRAGRTALGTCYRLWPEAEDHHLLPRATPEILEADLAPLALELAAAGIPDPATLRWLDPPPAAALAEARALLAELGALDTGGRITPHGRAIADLGGHPRLAHLLLAAAREDLPVAARLAALLEERDILRAPPGQGDPDLRLRLELLAERNPPPMYHGLTVDRGTLHRVREGARDWERQLRRHTSVAEPVSAAALVARAFPDRVGSRRAGQGGRFLLRNGQGAFTQAPSLIRSEFVVAAELDGHPRESRIWLGAPLERSEVLALFGSQLEIEDLVAWDEQADALLAVRRTRLGAIVMEEKPLRTPEPGLIQEVVLGRIRRVGLDRLGWSEESLGLRQRLAFCRRQLGADWPAVDDASLLQQLEQWAGPALTGIRRGVDLARLDPGPGLLGLLNWDQRRRLDELAPTHLAVPTGSRIRVDYTDPDAPVLAVRLQEVFGLTETPRLAGGKVPVTMHLLSPAQRPVQVTRDLAGFWRNSYFDVKKELKGRYPKHHWPDDPLLAEPTRRTKRRD